MRLLRLLAVPVLVVALIGCGGDDDDDGGAAEPSALDEAAAEQHVDALVTRLEADGFAKDPNDDGKDDPTGDDVAASCGDVAEVLGDDEHFPNETGDAETRTYQRFGNDPAGDLATIEASLSFVADETDLDPVFDALHDESVKTCLEDTMRQSFAKGAGDDSGIELTAFTLEATTPDIDAQDAVGYTGTGTIGAGDFTLDFTMRFVFARDERSAAMALSTELGSAEPVDLDGYVELLLG